MTQFSTGKSITAALILTLGSAPTIVIAGENHHRGNGNNSNRHGGWNGSVVSAPIYNHRDNWNGQNRYNSGWSNNGWGGSSWRGPQYNSRVFTNVYSGWNNYGSTWGNNGYGNGYGSGYDDYYRGRRSKTDTVALGVGLGILGLAVAAAASSGKSKNTRDRYDDNRSWSNPDDRRSDDRRDDVTYRGYPEPAYDANLPPAYNSSCLQTREYQTTIIVGGKRQAAYGTACLQPDGNWRQGPPVLEPN